MSALPIPEVWREYRRRRTLAWSIPAALFEQIIRTPPFLCIEILSPSDRVTEMQDRIDDYLNFGVRYVWLIHPSTQRAFVCSPGRVEEVRDGVLRTSDPDISVPFCDLETV